MLPDVMARSQFGSALITKLDPSKRSAMWICRDHDSFGYLCCDTRMGGETPERVRLTLNLQCGYSIETRGCGTANVIEQLVELSHPAPLAPRTQPDVAHSHGALSLLHIARLRVRRAPQPSNWRGQAGELRHHCIDTHTSRPLPTVYAFADARVCSNPQFSAAAVLRFMKPDRALSRGHRTGNLAALRLTKWAYRDQRRSHPVIEQLGYFQCASLSSAGTHQISSNSLRPRSSNCGS
jgi:hypothetical protein